MAGSGIAWIDAIFNAAVNALLALAALFGVTYEEINVYGLIGLVFLLPLMGLTILVQAMMIHRLRRRINGS